MNFIRAATHEDILDAFRHDSLVTAALAGQPWPETGSEKEAILRKPHRRVDKILERRWGLYELDRDELLDKVRMVAAENGT